MTCDTCNRGLDTAAKCAGSPTCSACAWEAGDLEVRGVVVRMDGYAALYRLLGPAANLLPAKIRRRYRRAA